MGKSRHRRRYHMADGGADMYRHEIHHDALPQSPPRQNLARVNGNVIDLASPEGGLVQVPEPSRAVRHEGSQNNRESGEARAESIGLALQMALVNLLEMFPSIDMEKAQQAVQLRMLEQGEDLNRALEVVTDSYLSNGYPRLEEAEPQPAAGFGGAEGASTSGGKEEDAKASDIFEAAPLPADVGSAYSIWTHWQLEQDFPRIAAPDIRKALKAHKQRYAATYKAIRAEWQRLLTATALQISSSAAASGSEASKEAAVAQAREGRPYWTGSGWRLLKKGRDKRKRPPDTPCLLFESERRAVLQWMAKDQEQVDMQLAEELNAQEYETTGQEISCGCCYADFPFERMVQCAEGHLFCIECVKRRVEESTFGGLSASGSLPCMDTDGCQASFPPSEIRRALPPQTLARYEQRQATEALLQAKVQLVQCPVCEFAVELPEGQRVLECPACRKDSCRLCREPSHIPLKCSEVEKKSETAFRTRVEELMSKALIRECSKCGTELVKQEGCNKITCRCGNTMCYVCRKDIPPTYTHFCQHVRDPGQDCTQCKKCSLWKDGDDDKEVRAVRDKAIREAAYLCPEAAEKMIGAPDDMAVVRRPNKQARHT